ncbi:MAG: hypothetical protein HGB12_15560 [Bacteroidetes bacterium]|nr:hypothetical protein [Bacteroidota bacterium]
MKIFFCIILFFLFFVTFSKAQDFDIISPRPHDTVKNGELFIVCKNILKNAKSIDVLLDEGIDLSYSTKISDNFVSALYVDKLKPGIHTIFVIFTTHDDKEIAKKWAFVVLKRKEEKKDIISKYGCARKDSIKFKGSINLYSKIKEISGNGSTYRTDPRLDNLADISGNIEYKKIKIPLRLFLTNHESGTIQPRDRFMIGFQLPRIKIATGNICPYYNKLILNGQNIFGVSADLSIGNRFAIQVVHGVINKAIEGSIGYYNIYMGLPPANMQADSSFNINGTYKRMVTAVNYVITENDKRSRTYITYLKSSDVQNSINYGGPVSQNLVVGVGHELKTQSDKFNLDAGIALSMTTLDIRSGVSSQKEIEDLYNVELKFDPAYYKNIIILNSTSTSYHFYTWPCPTVALFVNSKLKILKQRFSVNYYRVGSSYYSFGNPLLVNDKNNISVADQFTFWKKKINISLNYNYSNDNLSDDQSTTRYTHTPGGKLVFSPHKNLPNIMFTYNLINRIGLPKYGDDKVLNMLTENYMIGANYNKKTGKFEHACNIYYSHNKIKTMIPEKTKNLFDMINFYFCETFPNRISVALLSDRSLFQNDSLCLDSRNMYGFQIGYSNKKNNIKITTGVNQTLTKPTINVNKSERNNFNVNIQYNIFKNTTIFLQTGYSAYNENSNFPPDKNYTELFGMFNLRYMIN